MSSVTTARSSFSPSIRPSAKKDPWIVIERQYRHAAGQFLWELPAGKLDAGEVALEGAKRELAEETGYQAKKWSALVEYYASPGFLGESMKVFLAEGLVAGDAHPEEDEHIDFRLVKLSDLLEMVDKGKIIDGKTLTTDPALCAAAGPETQEMRLNAPAS
jgi:ADP-ribose pyrophosphatase